MRAPVQALHRFNVWVAHYGDAKKVIVGELVEEKAVQLASSVVTEAFIYTVRTTATPPCIYMARSIFTPDRPSGTL